MENLVDQVAALSDTVTDIKSQIADATLRRATLESMVDPMRSVKSSLIRIDEDDNSELQEAVDDLTTKVRSINDKVESLEKLIMMSSIQPEPATFSSGGSSSEEEILEKKPDEIQDKKPGGIPEKEPDKIPNRVPERLPSIHKKPSLVGGELEEVVSKDRPQSRRSSTGSQDLAKRSSASLQSLQQLQSKFKWLMQDMNRQLSGVKDSICTTNNDLKRLTARIDHQSRLTLSHTSIANMVSLYTLTLFSN